MINRDWRGIELNWEGKVEKNWRRVEIGIRGEEEKRSKMIFPL